MRWFHVLGKGEDRAMYENNGTLGVDRFVEFQWRVLSAESGESTEALQRDWDDRVSGALAAARDRAQPEFRRRARQRAPTETAPAPALPRPAATNLAASQRGAAAAASRARSAARPRARSAPRLRSHAPAAAAAAVPRARPGPGPSSNGDSDDLLGRRVEKEFPPFGMFEGTVTERFEDKSEVMHYLVVYDDGDKEHLVPAAVRAILVPPADATAADADADATNDDDDYAADDRAPGPAAAGPSEADDNHETPSADAAGHAEALLDGGKTDRFFRHYQAAHTAATFPPEDHYGNTMELPRQKVDENILNKVVPRIDDLLRAIAKSGETGALSDIMRHSELTLGENLYPCLTITLARFLAMIVSRQPKVRAHPPFPDPASTPLSLNPLPYRTPSAEHVHQRVCRTRPRGRDCRPH